MPRQNMDRQIRRTSVRSNSRGLILMLLLVALLAFSFWYPHDDGSTYGDVALLEAQNFTAKVARKTRGIYECATQGCQGKMSAPTPPSTVAGEGNASKSEAPLAAQEVLANATNTAPALTAPATPNFPVFRTLPILPPEISNHTAAYPTPPETQRAAQEAPSAPQLSQAPASSTLTPSTQALPGASAMPTPPSTASNFQTNRPFKSPQPTFIAPNRLEQAPFAAPGNAPSFSRSSPQAGKYLLAARQAVVQHRNQEAVFLYHKQLSDNPDDIDAYGELGNLLLITQRPMEAAQSYYEAATRLFDYGFAETARPLIPFIERYEPILANLLRQKAAQFDR